MFNFIKNLFKRYTEYTFLVNGTETITLPKTNNDLCYSPTENVQYELWVCYHKKTGMAKYKRIYK